MKCIQCILNTITLGFRAKDETKKKSSLSRSWWTLQMWFQGRGQSLRPQKKRIQLMSHYIFLANKMKAVCGTGVTQSLLRWSKADAGEPLITDDSIAVLVAQNDLCLFLSASPYPHNSLDVTLRSFFWKICFWSLQQWKHCQFRFVKQPLIPSSCGHTIHTLILYYYIWLLYNIYKINDFEASPTQVAAASERFEHT